MPEHAEILAGLYGLRVPGAGLPDLLVALGLGLLLGAVLMLVPRLLHPAERRQTPEDRIEALRNLPEPERILGFAHALKALTDAAAPGPNHWTERAAGQFRLDPGLLETLRTGLYAPGRGPDATRLEAALRQALSRTKG